MPTIDNYTAYDQAYHWTGLNNQNQAWSYFRVDEPIIVTSIECYWGGYGTSSTGKHAIWNWTSGAGNTLNGLVVASGTISVPADREWRVANITDTYLPAGNYAVGVWADPAKDRIFGEWIGDGASTLYLEDAVGGLENTAVADTSQGQGVLPCRLNYEYPGRIKIKNAGSWKTGQAWIKDGGSWRKSKGVWIKTGGAWKRSNI
jgi:hypothetical protein